MQAEREPVLAADIPVRDLSLLSKFEELSQSTRSSKESTHIPPTEMAENESLLKDVDMVIERVNEILQDNDLDEFEVGATQTGIQQVTRFYRKFYMRPITRELWNRKR